MGIISAWRLQCNILPSFYEKPDSLSVSSSDCKSSLTCESVHPLRLDLNSDCKPEVYPTMRLCLSSACSKIETDKLQKLTVIRYLFIIWPMNQLSD